MGSRETGQVAYEAYGTSRGWVYPGGVRMRRWADLDETEKDHWRAAAHEVMQKGWREVQRLSCKHPPRGRRQEPGPSTPPL